MSKPQKDKFKARAELFKKQHGFIVDGGNASNPVPNDDLLPVPGSFRVSLGNDEIEFSPKDMTVIEMLGKGAHGQVDKMIHVPTKTPLDVKTIPWKLNSGDDSVRLKRELDVSLQASLCPHVVKCYGALYQEGSVWICMEVMDASMEKFYETAFTALQIKTMPEPLLGYIAYCIISALQHLKTQLNVIHRDIKPSNILINRNGEIKICDFGISGKLVDSLARSHVGCRNYMAPERVSCDNQTGYDITSDVWSLGISLIEIATGLYPYRDFKSYFDLVEKVVKGDPPLPPPGQFSPDMEDFLHKCLQKDPRCRPRYPDLLDHPFIIAHKNANISAFVAEVIDKLPPRRH